MNLNENIERILVSKEEIAKRTAELGDRISRDYKGKRPLLVCVLKGSVMFFSDLVRRITEDVELDFMAISSYGSGSTSSGEVRVLKDLGVKVEGRDLLVIEDIVDSGITLYYLTNLLKTRGAASVEICTLLDKPERRQRDLKPTTAAAGGGAGRDSLPTGGRFPSGPHPDHRSGWEWATGWIMPSATAICPTFACSIQKHTVE